MGAERGVQASRIQISEQCDLRVAARNAVLKQSQGRHGVVEFGDAPDKFTRSMSIELHLISTAPVSAGLMPARLRARVRFAGRLVFFKFKARPLSGALCGTCIERNCRHVPRLI